MPNWIRTRRSTRRADGSPGRGLQGVVWHGGVVQAMVAEERREERERPVCTPGRQLRQHAVERARANRPDATLHTHALRA